MRLVVLRHGSDLAEWRVQARILLKERVLPADVLWQVGEATDLLVAISTPTPPAVDNVKAIAVPAAFLRLADTVLAHTDSRRHAVLYRLLWRIAQGERALLSIASDEDFAWCELAAKAVRRDMHKMKAFVRFRETKQPHGSVFIAWFEPAHDILPRVAPFFVRRFAGMHWSILTPLRSAHWDGETLTFDAGTDKSHAPKEDQLEDLWLTYFASIFNPARLKVQAMKNEMPVRYWKNLPEAVLIPSLVRNASSRMDAMVREAPTLPKKHIPAPIARETVAAPAGSIAELRIAASQCKACPLWEPATQVVFGEGPDNARIMVIGEQPGDQEDLVGRPFVGPAGQLFDWSLRQAGIPRDQLYITNTVKHFKFQPRGKRRLHARANAREQLACRKWLEAEIERVAPQAIICLGAMAAQSIFGPTFRLLEQRGQWLMLNNGIRALATVHPSYLLRLPDEPTRQLALAEFVSDLATLGEVL